MDIYCYNREDKLILVWDWRNEEKVFHALASKFKINRLLYCEDGITIVAATTRGVKIWKADTAISDSIVKAGEDKVMSVEDRTGTSPRLRCFQTMNYGGT